MTGLYRLPGDTIPHAFLRRTSAPARAACDAVFFGFLCDLLHPMAPMLIACCVRRAIQSDAIRCNPMLWLLPGRGPIQVTKILICTRTHSQLSQLMYGGRTLEQGPLFPPQVAPSLSRGALPTPQFLYSSPLSSFCIVPHSPEFGALHRGGFLYTNHFIQYNPVYPGCPVYSMHAVLREGSTKHACGPAM